VPLAPVPPPAPARRLHAAFLAALVVAVGALLVLRPRAPAPVPGRVMLAVLPFANLDGDVGQEFFSDGLTDEMINRLGALQPDGLGVIARTSAMQYKRTSKRADQIGRELGVQYLLEGSVRRARGRVRISARLIQLSDQTPLFSREYEGELSDVLTLQQDVARSVAEEIRLQLSPEAHGRLAAARPVDPEAYEQCLRGRYAWNQRRAAALRAALGHFEAAIARDPLYAPAHAGLADTYSLFSYYGGLPPREVFPKARSAAQRALALDPQQAEAHTSLAYVLHRFDWEWARAEESYRRALELNPSYATAHHWYAEFLMVMGRLPEARREIRAAQQLDPLSARINLDVGLPDYFEGRHDAAIAVARRVAELHPGFVPAQTALRQACERKGLYREAVQALERTAEGLGVETGPAAEVRAAVEASGGTGYWKALLRQADRGWPAPESPAHRANMWAALGDREQALRWLERAHAERDDELVWIAVEPWYEPLRADPRFKALLERMGLR
jgi:TolB-like protein/Tfp pilus assembly protein PilF